MWSLGRIATASRHLTQSSFSVNHNIVDYNNIYFYCKVNFILQHIPATMSAMEHKSKTTNLEAKVIFSSTSIRDVKTELWTFTFAEPRTGSPKKMDV